MADAAGGALALAALGLLCAVPIYLSMRRRAVDDVVTLGWVDGARGLAVHPERGHRLLRVLAWAVSLGLVAVGVALLHPAPYGGSLTLVVGAYLVYRSWALATGRTGDGTLTFTAEGIHQLWSASEIFVPWDDVRGLVTTPKDFIVETTHPVQHRRTLPLVGGHRRVRLEDAVSLPHTFLPLLPYQEMVELYATNPESRRELTSDAPVERARQILTEQRRGRAS